MTDGPEGLQHLVAAIEAGAELSAEQRRALAAALRMLPEAKLTERNDLLIKLRNQFFSDWSDNSAACEIAKLWKRYATDAWPRDRSAPTCPSRHLGTPRSFFFAIMRISPRVLKHEMVRKIVGNCDYQRAASR